MAHQILSDVIDHKCKYLDIAVISPLKALFADRRFDRTSSPSAFRAFIRIEGTNTSHRA